MLLSGGEPVQIWVETNGAETSVQVLSTFVRFTNPCFHVKHLFSWLCWEGSVVCAKWPGGFWTWDAIVNGAYSPFRLIWIVKISFLFEAYFNTSSCTYMRICGFNIYCFSCFTLKIQELAHGADWVFFFHACFQDSPASRARIGWQHPASYAVIGHNWSLILPPALGLASSSYLQTITRPSMKR